MDSHALRVLEYQSVLDLLAGQTTTEMGAKAARELAPSTDLDEVETRQSLTQQSRRLLDDFGGMPFGGIRNISSHIEKALMAGALNGQELIEIRDTLNAVDNLSKFIRKHYQIAPDIGKLSEFLVSIPELSAAISSAIDDSGEVKDSASDTLSRLRRDIRTVLGRIQSKLQSITNSYSARDALQEPVIVTRHGRWCVPVKSDHKSAIAGIVHDASSSGATLFIEPQAVVEMGNKLRELEASELEEVQRILRELTHKVVQYADDLIQTLYTTAQLDIINAMALLAEAMKATRPVVKRGCFINLISARHPLLKGDVVPVDIKLGGNIKGMLITGPNTGGKTVTLKTAGLLVLMAQSGLQIPASAQSEIGIFSDIFADIGDEQSIEQSLSTFSGHIRNIIHTLNNVAPGSLVLFDELGAGTDPAEGAALASAVLTWLSKMEICIMATTHYGELKNFAFLDNSFVNACVEFDRETLRPTYKLLTGVPGASHALHIAEKLGMPSDVINFAKSSLESGSSQSDELIRLVEESRLKALEQQRQAEAVLFEAEGLKCKYEEGISKLDETRQRLKETVQSEALKAVKNTRAELEKVLRELRTQKRHSAHTEGLANKAKKLVGNLETASEKLATSPQKEAETEIGPIGLKKGDRVKMLGLGAVGTLIDDPKDGMATVSLGHMDAKVSVERLELIETNTTEKPLSRGTSIELSKAIAVSPEIMLRGQRVEEAIERLDRYLDDACLAGLNRVRVIHGKGTGVMRKAVWEFMRKHPLVSSLQFADASEGGQGATIVTLK